jgi:hypothetical protein
MLRLCRFLLIVAIAAIVCSCQPTASNPSSYPESRFKAVVVEADKVVAGQTVYVPVYSHIYQRNVNNPVMQLSATLSVRNTDLNDPLTLSSVRYYDSNGEFIRDCLETPIEIPPLATADYLIETEDDTGGIGANFIVEWVSETETAEPIIEALMITTTGNQGISFISPGRVIARQGIQVSNPTTAQ